MAFDAAFVIRAGSAVLFVALALPILVVARSNRHALALGAFLLLIGVATVLTNVRVSFETPAFFWAELVILSLIGPSAFVLAVLGLGVPPTRRVDLAIGIACGLAVLVGFAGHERLTDALGPRNIVEGRTVVLVLGGLIVYIVGTVTLVVSVSVRLAMDPPRDRAQWVRTAAPVALMGPYIVFYMPIRFAAPLSPWTLAATTVVALALAIPWLVAATRGRSRFALLVALVWPALALADYAYHLHPQNGPPQWDAFGVYGMLRIVGWSFLVYAILRADLLGVRLPRIAVSKGALAAGALATLFIVAQIAQNFLSASYGLLTGGIVAGAFLFAAQPLQRAMESLISPRPAEPATRRVPVQDASAEVLYRETLRMAMKDGRVTSEEEQHLAELGERLGISARRAVALRHEIEREKGAR